MFHSSSCRRVWDLSSETMGRRLLSHFYCKIPILIQYPFASSITLITQNIPFHFGFSAKMMHTNKLFTQISKLTTVGRMISRRNNLRNFSTVQDSTSDEKILDDIFNMRSYSSNMNLDKELLIYSNKKQTPVSLRTLMETGLGENLERFEELMKGKYAHTPAPKASQRILIQVACFLHRELPVRLAHRAIRLEGHPLFQQSEFIKQVSSWYKTSFAQLRSCPVPNDPKKEEMFAKVISSIYDRHSSTLITMAKGAHEIRNLLKQDINAFADHDDLQKRLEEFYMSRIGIRMLIGQYLALRETSSESNMIGLIDLKSSPYDIARQAIQDASYICNRTHGDAPEVHIYGRTDLHFPYVSSHISYIMLELLKNSMRATIETHGTDNMPPIRVIIADGEDNEDVVIKVSDEGGGIRRSNMPRVWSYLYTTADPSVLERMIGVDGEDVKDFGISSPLAGLGYGLPIARNYARCFEGDLILMSMEGYGTDSFIYLPRLGSKDTAV